MGEQTPEYQVIRQGRGDSLLADLLRIHFRSVADAFLNCDILTDAQHREIIPSGEPDRLINAVLIDLRTSSNPCESFVRFLNILEQCGNLAMKRHVNTMKTNRKALYRALLEPSAGVTLVSEYDVFVSYGRQDNTNDFVDALAQKLEESQFKVFVDRSNIHPGDRWPDEISNALRSCKAFIAVLTKKYVRSHFCNGELFEAEALQKHLFPIVYEDDWDKGPAGTPVKEVVGQYQYAFCQPGKATLDEQYPALEKNLKKKIGTDDSQEPEPSVKIDLEISLMNIDSKQLEKPTPNLLRDDLWQPQLPTLLDATSSNSESDDSQQSEHIAPFEVPSSSDDSEQLEPPTTHDVRSSISDNSEQHLHLQNGLMLSNTGTCECHNICVLTAFWVALLSACIVTFPDYQPPDIVWPSLQWNSSYQEVLEILTNMQNCSDTIKVLGIGDSVKTFEWISNELHQIKSELVDASSVHVGIVGLSETEKQTFLNALLGKSFLPRSLQAQTADKVVIVHDETKPHGELHCSTEGDSTLLASRQKEIYQLLLSNDDSEVRELDRDRAEVDMVKCHKLALHAQLQFLSKSDVQHVSFELFPGFGEAGVVEGVSTAIKDMYAVVVILDSSKPLKSSEESKLFKDLKHNHPELFSTLNDRLLILINAGTDVYSKGRLTRDNASILPEDLPAYVWNYIKGPDFNLIEISIEQILHFSALWALRSREWKDPSVLREDKNAKTLYIEAMQMLRYVRNKEDADNLEDNMSLSDENIKKTSSLLEPISQIQMVENRLQNVIESGASDLQERAVNDAISAIKSLLSLANVSMVIKDVSETRPRGDWPGTSLKCTEELRKLLEHLV